MEVNSRSKKYTMMGSIAFLSAILLFSMTASSAFAHMRQLLTIGGKQYLLEVGSQVEPPYVGDKNGVQFFAWTPDPKDPAATYQYFGSEVREMSAHFNISKY